MFVNPAWLPLYRCPSDSLEHLFVRLLRDKGVGGCAEFLAVPRADVRLWITEKHIPEQHGEAIRAEIERRAGALRRQNNGAWEMYRRAYANKEGSVLALAKRFDVSKQAVAKAIAYKPKVGPEPEPDAPPAQGPSDAPEAQPEASAAVVVPDPVPEPDPPPEPAEVIELKRPRRASSTRRG